MSGARADVSFADIKAEMLRRLPSLLREILPGGKKVGGAWLVSSPHRRDANPSMYVYFNTGAWKDEPAEQGDLIDLVMYVMRLQDRRDTRAWCLDWLGWVHGVDRRKLETSRKADAYFQKQQSKIDRDELARKRGGAQAMFYKADAKWRGTALENYLVNARGIDLSVFKGPRGGANLPGALRLMHAEHNDVDGVITGPWPVMLAAITGADGKIVAVHRTWLEHDGSGKAPVVPAKKIWPSGWAGGVIRLSKGEGRLTPEQAALKGRTAPCAIAEGIETALSLATVDPTLRVWAAGTMANMANVPDHDCVSAWILAHDHIKSSLPDEAILRHGEKLKQIRAHFERTGKPVEEIFPGEGDDFNDDLRGD